MIASFHSKMKAMPYSESDINRQELTAEWQETFVTLTWESHVWIRGNILICSSDCKVRGKFLDFEVQRPDGGIRGNSPIRRKTRGPWEYLFMKTFNVRTPGLIWTRSVSDAWIPMPPLTSCVLWVANLTSPSFNFFLLKTGITMLLLRDVIKIKGKHV